MGKKLSERNLLITCGFSKQFLVLTQFSVFGGIFDHLKQLLQFQIQFSPFFYKFDLF